MRIRTKVRTHNSLGQLEQMTLEIELPNNLAELVNTYGTHEVTMMVRAYLTKRYRDVARRLMRQGRSEDGIRRFMKSYKP